MKINFLGDSITAGAKLDSVEEIYTYKLCKKLGAIEKNFGVSGTRFARQTKPSIDSKFDLDFLLRAQSLDFTADFTFVFGGTNDYGHGDAPLGFADDNTPYSFYGATNLLIDFLINKFGKEKICFILPLPRFDEDNPFGEHSCKLKKSVPLSKYRKAIIFLCKKRDIDFIDLSNIFPRPKDENGDKYTVDGLHPNDYGQTLIFEKLFEYIKNKTIL